jgi:hypothetical protein
MSEFKNDRPPGAVLYSEKLLGLRSECPACGEWENSTGWLLRSEEDTLFRWYVDLKCSGCRGRGGTWKRDWQALTDEVFQSEINEIRQRVAPEAPPEAGDSRSQTEIKITHIEIDWSETAGQFMNTGSPYLFGCLRAVYMPGMTFSGCAVSVLALDDEGRQWTDYKGPLTRSDAEELAAALTALSLPTRAPRIQGYPSSADVWRACHVRVAIGETAGTFSVLTEDRGFWGPDAEGLRRVFQRVYELAGYDRERTIFRDSY